MSNPSVVVATPGLSGGVDEAVRHLFGGDPLTDRWSVRVLISRGHRSPLAPLVLLAAIVRLAAWRIAGRVDLVHLNVSSRGSAARKIVLALAARLLRTPYVIQLHGGGFAPFYEGLGRRGRRLVRAFFGNADHVFVLGLPFRRLVEDRLGVEPSRVSILRNAVPVDARPPAGQRSVPPLVLFTGRLGPGKGTPELVEALAEVDDLDWRAVLAGDGDVAGTRDRVDGAGLAGRVEVRGWQSREAVTELLGAAEVFVLPSHREALSVALLEAMVAGLCCITTPVGAQGEVVDDEENGLLVEPGDVAGLAKGLRRVLTDAELRHRLGDRARRTIEESCSTEVVAAELTATYRTILSPT